MLFFSIGGYLVLCFMVALLGRRSRLGFFRGFLFSIMLTPFLITLYLLIFMSMESEASEE
jgi:hypothetical protein